MRKTSIRALCVALIVLLCSSCARYVSYNQPEFEDVFHSIYGVQPGNSGQPAPVQVPNMPSVPTPVQPPNQTTPSPTPSQPTPVQTPNQPTQTGKVTVHTLQELIDYLNQQRRQGIFVTELRYPNQLSKEDLRRIASGVPTMYTSYSALGEEYTFTLTPYPGYRIVQAYFSGDTSQLNGDEVRALNIAEQMVAQAKAQTSDPVELELLLYDMFREHVTYYGGTTDIDDVNNPPRHLTAVGSLVDKRANCQGCADGFYVLCSMAGMTIDRMNGKLDGELHQFNIINLDGAWYVVDATASEEKGQKTYHHFNAGLDMCGGLSWEPEEEHTPLAATSGRNYYYLFQNGSADHNYQKTYTNLNDLAAAAVHEYDKNGRELVHLMLKGQVVTQAQVGKAVQAQCKGLNRAVSYSYGAGARGDHTYIFVRFSK